MNVRAAGLTAIVVAGWTSLAAAGPVADAAARAEALLVEGDVAGALEALNEAIDAVWEEADRLTFRRIAVVESASGYGVYEETRDATFRPDEKLTVYVEPVGFGRGATNGGSIGFTIDLAIENSTGQVLGEHDGVFSVTAPFAAGRHEFDMVLTFDVPFLRPGEYSAVFTVHDQNSDKTGEFTVPFGVALPGG